MNGVGAASPGARPSRGAYFTLETLDSQISDSTIKHGKKKINKERYDRGERGVDLAFFARHSETRSINGPSCTPPTEPDAVFNRSVDEGPAAL